MKKLFLAAAAAFALVAPAHAAVVFTDNFNGYPQGVPWAGGGGWTATNVDLVQSGNFNLQCAGGSGRCVDLSASTPGSIARSFTLAPGLHQLTFDYTGNQLDGIGAAPNIRPVAGFRVRIGTLDIIVTPPNNNPVSSANPFNSFSANFTASGSDTLTISQLAGGDNFRGSIVDNVMIAAVPEPSTWLMLLAGFGLVGGALRRRKPQTQLSFS